MGGWGGRGQRLLQPAVSTEFSPGQGRGIKKLN